MGGDNAPSSHTAMKIERIVSTRLPTPYGEFAIHGFREGDSGQEHVVLSMGELTGDDPPLVRVHSECMTGEVFGSLRCDCRPQLEAAMKRIAAQGRGAIVYMRGHEGRGIGLVQKLRAYADPAVRQKLHEEMVEWKVEIPGNTIAREWYNYIWVEEPKLEKNKWMTGKTVNQIAQAQNKRIIDAFLDLVVEEKLETVFMQAENNIDPEAMRAIRATYTEEGARDEDPAQHATLVAYQVFGHPRLMLTQPG